MRHDTGSQVMYDTGSQVKHYTGSHVRYDTGSQVRHDTGSQVKVSYKLLGIHVDNTLSWKTHITHLCSNLRSRLHLFNQGKHIMLLSIRKQNISGLVRSVIDFECVILGNCSRDLLRKVQKMMKMYTSSIVDIKDKRQSSSVKLFQTLGWIPVDVCINYFTDIQMYIIHDNAPSYLNEMFKTNSPIHAHNTRNNKSLYLPKYNLVTWLRTFKFRGTKLCENLTNNIKEALSIDSFKSKYKTKLISDLYDCERFALNPLHYYQEYGPFNM